MNRITDEFKKKIAARHRNSIQSQKAFQSDPANQWINNTELKFMQHFQSINTNNSNPQSQDLAPQDYEYKFAQAIEDYKIQTSAIEGIINSYENAEGIVPAVIAFCEQPSLPKINANLSEELKRISKFFEGKQSVQIKLNPDQLLDLQKYSSVLQSFGRRNRVMEIKKMLLKNYSSVKMPSPSPAKVAKDFQVDTEQLQEMNRQELQSMKRLDLILLQLVNQKKRKSYAADYFTVMEMKLMQLLEYILKDEPQYSGLNPTSKTKLVLRNLQSFKGKEVDGESKINLLRIFFQDFTALKREKELQDQQKEVTPMKKIDNNKTTRLSSTNKYGSSLKKAAPISYPRPKIKKSFQKSATYNKQDEWLGHIK